MPVTNKFFTGKDMDDVKALHGIIYMGNNNSPIIKYDSLEQIVRKLLNEINLLKQKVAHLEQFPPEPSGGDDFMLINNGDALLINGIDQFVI